jgi:hypothetical protein
MGYGYSLQWIILGMGGINSVKPGGGIRACPFLVINRNKKKIKEDL